MVGVDQLVRKELRQRADDTDDVDGCARHQLATTTSTSSFRLTVIVVVVVVRTTTIMMGRPVWFDLL